MFQFWALQLVLLIAIFIKRNGRENAGAGRRLRTKAILLAAEGLLLLTIAWLWKDNAESLPLYYLVAGCLWILAGGLLYAYVVFSGEDKGRAEREKKSLVQPNLKVCPPAKTACDSAKPDDTFNTALWLIMSGLGDVAQDAFAEAWPGFPG